MARRKSQREFATMRSILADALGTRRKSRPVSYNAKDAAALAIQGLYEYLADIAAAGHPDDAKIAAQHYQELQGAEKEHLLRSIQSLLPLLVASHPRGARIYNVLWRRAPYHLGWAYGKYLVTASADIATEDLLETYAEVKSA